MKQIVQLREACVNYTILILSVLTVLKRGLPVPAEKEQVDNLLRYAEMIVKSDGVFAFANVAPGRYRLVMRAVADEEIFSDARPAAWDAQSRLKLFGEADTTGTVIELKPCQKVVDYLLHLPSTANKKAD